MNGTPGFRSETCPKHYAEEDWIDWLLGRKPKLEYETMTGHLERCPRCRGIEAAWAPLLKNDGLRENDVPADGPRMAKSHLLSEAMHRRLRGRVRLRAAGIRARRALHAHRRTAVALAAAAALLLCVAGLYRTTASQSDQRKAAAAVLEPTAQSFLEDPQTASYRIHPGQEALGEGYIWFNDSSGEMYVMLDGVLPSEDHDVQAWAVDAQERERVNLGLLHHDRASRAYLYIRKGMLLQAHHIALTVEPSGGSSMPTEPDALVFRLRRG
ncbi:anti-sigma factor [Paenibacillus sacheonensis]|uniref:Anti-sigma K factor RskA C-terminal domain-containing protein n=1 Tax=Paenibacillus sacheonensis TaxID=742054 RepID=A0A7X5BZV8_9BACL|nr:anti-sigma factor [Paenibacillus sacheonensis]MBM7563863.1 anti-sigma-K factor RskA [Paenibacillus sacheonensis]NBC67789.1 hypothetical protein [Paenibacillus sacheonensis]